MTKRPGAGIGLLVALVILLGGCASTGGQERSSTDYSENMGRVLYSTLMEGMQTILPRYNLALERREEQFSTLHFQTEWKPREVTAEEEQNNVIQAQERLVLRGRRTGTEPDGEGLFRVRLEAQNRVRSRSRSDWHPAPVPDEFVERWREIATELTLEIRTGVR